MEHFVLFTIVLSVVSLLSVIIAEPQPSMIHNIEPIQTDIKEGAELSAPTEKSSITSVDTTSTDVTENR
jgi:hypothetical protein